MPYQLLAQEIILCTLRDYQQGKLSREEILIWVDDRDTFSFYALCMTVAIDDVRAYVQNKMLSIDQSGVFTV